MARRPGRFDGAVGFVDAIGAAGVAGRAGEVCVGWLGGVYTGAGVGVTAGDVTTLTGEAVTGVTGVTVVTGAAELAGAGATCG